MLIDKGYYDYDYEPLKQAAAKVKNYDESVRSDEEMQSILARFGWGVQKQSEPPTAEEIQREIMGRINDKGEE